MYRIYAYKFLIDFWCIVPVIVPFYKAHGLNAAQILTVQAAFSLSQFIFEIPSGYFSDVIGRRKTLIFAAILMLSGITIYSMSSSFWLFVCAELVLGIAGALRSGTDSAILYDTLKEIKDEHRYKQCEGYAEFLCRFGTAASSLIGGILGTYATLRLPFYVNMVSATIMIFIGLSLREPFRTQRPHGNPFTMIGKIAITSLKNRFLFLPMLQMAIITTVGITGIWGYFLLYRQVGLPLWVHGIIFAAMQMLSGIGAKNAHAIEHGIGTARSLQIIMTTGILFILIGLCNHIFLLITLVLIQAFLWGVSTPIFLGQIQHHTTSDIRATTLSVASMMGRILTIGWGPVFGSIVDTTSISFAFFSMAAFFYLVLFSGMIIYRHMVPMSITSPL